MVDKKEKARRILRDLCFFCGKKADHQHHIIPQSFAGPDVTIPLCGMHHAACHGLGHRVWGNHSENVKTAMRAAKLRGVKLGTQNKALRHMPEKNRKKADDFAKKMIPIVSGMVCDNHDTLMKLTEEMNRRNVETFTGSGRWHISSTHNLIKRIERITGVSWKEAA